jgi:hypothetical protein
MPSGLPTLLRLLARKNVVLKERWQRQNEYAIAAQKDKPAIEKEIETLTGEIDKLEAEIFHNRPATQS